MRGSPLDNLFDDPLRELFLAVKGSAFMAVANSSAKGYQLFQDCLRAKASGIVGIPDIYPA